MRTSAQSRSATLRCATAWILLLALPPVAARAAAEPDLDATIAYLLDRVLTSDLVFIRNGKDHDGAEAAEHMRRKYEHFRDDIATANDFIRLAASKSLLSRKPYLVRLKDGSTVPTRTWLEEALRAYREKASSPEASGS